MKIISVGFDDSVDISAIAVGATGVSVSDGTNTITSGEVVAVTQVVNPSTDVPAHTHTASTTVGPVT